MTRAWSVCMVTVAMVLSPFGRLWAQPSPTAVKRSKIRRTADGHADLQGLWLNNTATPLERPKGFEDRPFFTKEEAFTFEQTYLMERVRADSASGRGGNSNDFDVDSAMAASDIDTFEAGHVLPSRRTSMVVDPPSGKVPPLSTQARSRLAERATRLQQHYAENPENLPSSERCLVIGNTAVPPLLPNVHNNTLQFVQTRDSVVIVSETIHDARIISLSRVGHLPALITQWKGDSIGHWVGDTLVVDTTNFSNQTAFRGSGPRLHVVERFTPLADDALSYEFTIEDPDSFAQSRLSLSHSTFEFSNLEGNRGCLDVLDVAVCGECEPACAECVRPKALERRVRADELGSVSHQWRAEHSAK